MRSPETLADHVSRAVGVPVALRPAQSYDAVIDGLDSDAVDVAFLPTLAYVLARDRCRANPLLVLTRHGTRTQRGVYLARVGSGIRRFPDAKGKRVVLAGPQSASGHLFPMAEAARLAGDPQAFFGEIATTDDARALIAGEVDLAAVDADAAARLPRRLVKIGQTEEAPDGTISVRAGPATTLMGRTQKALLTFAATPQGREFLADAFGADGLAPANDREYDAVRVAADAVKIPLEHYSARPSHQKP